MADAADSKNSPTREVAQLETVATFDESMPTGVTVARSGRIFVNYPRWGDPVPFTVAEVKKGRATAYPNSEINKLDTNRSGETFVSVQSVVVDPRDRLWVLDTGSPKFKLVRPEAAKLIGIDLSSNRIFKIIHFPSDVLLPSTYLNDVRFDLRKGQEGVAYITDSSDKGANGIIVVDLGSGKSWRRLNDHPSTKAENNFVPTVEGKPLMRRKPAQPPEPIRIGADGIALSSDGARLFYCPLASRKLYSVSTAALLDQSLSEDRVGETVKDEGIKPASDGLEMDAEGRLYATDYEHNAIVRLGHAKFDTIASDPEMLWPDTMSIASNGYLYFIANQLHRQPDFHEGKDLRVKPYKLFRVRIDGTPVRLGGDEKQLVREKEIK
ncbi:MAG TPA: L-dopachrome tautomerase-related protein [Methylomirabilota bacterium]|nr:L-dopachrome tautomerase-related protein [Methylomirabilota bacterium]